MALDIVRPDLYGGPCIIFNETGEFNVVTYAGMHLEEG